MSTYPDAPRETHGERPVFSDDELNMIILVLLERRMDLRPTHGDYAPLGKIIDRVSNYLGLDDGE